MEVRRKKRTGAGQRLANCWYEAERGPTWVPECGAKENRTNPWSALLNVPMLAHGLSSGNVSRVTGDLWSWPRLEQGAHGIGPCPLCALQLATVGLK